MIAPAYIRDPHDSIMADLKAGEVYRVEHINGQLVLVLVGYTGEHGELIASSAPKS